MDKKIFKIRLCLWLTLAAVIGCFIYLKIVPGGKISYKIKAGEPNYFIGKLTPAERVKTDGDNVVVKGDPVYFSLNPPRRFENAKVTVKFKNETDFPVVELGVLNDKVAWNYDLKPLENKIIDQLSLVWPVVYGADGSRLIQREKKYNSVEEFLKNLPPKDEIAVYDYDLKTEFKLADYKPSAEVKTINCGFRGAFQFYTYLKNEDLNYIFDFKDLNLNKDDDSVKIKVYGPTGLVYEKDIDDDKNDERQAIVKISDLPEGIYRINFIANDDIVTQSLTSRQSKFSLINKIWLTDVGGRILHTDSREVSAQTINPGSLGQIRVGDEVIDLNETYKQFSLLTDKRPTTVELPKNDIIVSGDGVFAFSTDAIIDPKINNIDRNLDVSQEKINYILTGYQAAKQTDGWQTAEAEFDLTQAYQEKGKFQFLISIPGFKAENENNGQMAIKEIHIELNGTSLIEKIKKIFKMVL